MVYVPLMVYVPSILRVISCCVVSEYEVFRLCCHLQPMFSSSCASGVRCRYTYVRLQVALLEVSQQRKKLSAIHFCVLAVVCTLLAWRGSDSVRYVVYVRHAAGLCITRRVRKNEHFRLFFSVLF